MVDFQQKQCYDIKDFKEIIRLLRSEEGCPWDREQTHLSLRRNLLEEAYEVCEAIDDDDAEHLCEELGDLLLHVLFHCRIEEEAGRFSLETLVDLACKKMLRRHPHVFAGQTADTSTAVIESWEAIKRRERGQQSVAQSMDTVAKSLPALWRADKILSKSEKALGFKPDTAAAAAQIQAAATILTECPEGAASQAAISQILFAACKAARARALDPEQLLHTQCDVFTAEFAASEDKNTSLHNSL